MGRSSRLRALLAVAIAACGACGTTIELNPAGSEISLARLAAVPSSAVEWEFDFHGDHDVNDEWTYAATENVNAAIHDSVSSRGGRSVPDETVEKLDGYESFRHWAELVLVDVMNAAAGRLRDPPASVSDWFYRYDLRSWRGPLAADHVLITYFLDGHDTAGRTVAVALVGGWRARHDAASCAVRLMDGRLVWCAIHSLFFDIRERAGAQRVVEGLMGAMLDHAARTKPSSRPFLELPKSSTNQRPPARRRDDQYDD